MSAEHHREQMLEKIDQLRAEFERYSAKFVEGLAALTQLCQQQQQQQQQQDQPAAHDPHDAPEHDHREEPLGDGAQLPAAQLEQPPEETIELELYAPNDDVVAMEDAADPAPAAVEAAQELLPATSDAHGWFFMKLHGEERSTCDPIMYPSLLPATCSRATTGPAPLHLCSTLPGRRDRRRDRRARDAERRGGRRVGVAASRQL
jgi:hypothetical protein